MFVARAFFVLSVKMRQVAATDARAGGSGTAPAGGRSGAVSGGVGDRIGEDASIPCNLRFCGPPGWLGVTKRP